MVQRKAEDKQKSSIKHKFCHGGLQRKFPNIQQDERNRGGVDLNTVKSIKISDFNSFEHPLMDFQFKKTSFSKYISHNPIKNYMKPTKSSDAKKEILQEKKNSHSLKNLNPSFSSFVYNDLNRGTCSSILKDFKFSETLELNNGVNEAKGISKIRVCPYSYCSLNGHISFGFAKRNLVKNKRSLKLKKLSLFKTNLLKKEGEIIDDVFDDEISMNLTDFFPEVYDIPQEETSIFEEKCHELISLDISFECDYDMNKKSEFSQDEVEDVKVNFFESQINCEVEKLEIETMDEKCGEKICFFPYEMKVSEFLDNQPCVNRRNSYAKSEELEDVVLETKEGDSNVIEKNDSDIYDLNSQSIIEEVQNLQSEIMNQKKELFDSSNGIDKNTKNVSNVVLCSRWNITKKKTSEEFHQVKEFNPKTPNFLLLEPDPDLEKVDLKHKTIDDRRNSEEWMIDHALQRAVTKLGSARKKKVALLVEAFETVLPLPPCEKHLSHESPTFNHLSFIQACN